MTTSKKWLRSFRSPVDQPQSQELISQLIKSQKIVNEDPVFSESKPLKRPRPRSLPYPLERSDFISDKENILQLSLPPIRYEMKSSFLPAREEKKPKEEKKSRKKWYTRTHLWYNEKNGKVGITDYGLKQSFYPLPKSEVFIYRRFGDNFPKSVRQGDYIGSVIYRVSDKSSKFHIFRNYHLYAPVSGILTNINPKLIKGNRPVIESSDEWIVRIVSDPSSDIPTDMDLLLDSTMYSLYLKRVAST